MVTASVLLFCLLDSHPLTVARHQLDAQSAQQGKQFLKRLHSTAYSNVSLRFINMNQDEMNGLIALMQRALPQVIANAQLGNDAIYVDLTIQLPLPNAFKYLNVSTKVLSSSDGIKLSRVNAGALSVDGDTLLSSLIWLVDVAVKDQLASQALAIIKTVKINQERVFILAEFDQNLLGMKNEKSMLMTIRDELGLLGDVNRIRSYYQSLVVFSRQFENVQDKPNITVASFIRYLFEQVNSNLSKDPINVKEENQAALTALALYFGTERFKLLVGEFEPLTKEDERQRTYLQANTTLQGRVDLQKHFIYSIALQLFSTGYASDAIGEFKEFLDANQGGSGFSFADLQADRAGTRLAIILTQSKDIAMKAIALLKDIEDNTLLPSINGLEEGITAQHFTNEYKTVNSLAYKSMLEEIDTRLKTLPIYQLGW